MPDLWPPELEVSDVTLPLGVLREQADLLKVKTKNQIEGKVQISKNDGDFFQTFYLVVPSLKNYTYRLFTVIHPAMLYPLIFDSSALPAKLQVAGAARTSTDTVRCNDEAAFHAVLKAALSSDTTKRLIGNLLAIIGSEQGQRENGQLIDEDDDSDEVA